MVHPPFRPAGAELHVEAAREGAGRQSLFGGLVLVAVRLHSWLLRRFRRACFPGPEGREGPRVLRAWVTVPSVSAVRGDFPVWRGDVLGEGGCSALNLGWVGGHMLQEGQPAPVPWALRPPSSAGTPDSVPLRRSLAACPTRRAVRPRRPGAPSRTSSGLPRTGRTASGRTR